MLMGAFFHGFTHIARDRERGRVYTDDRWFCPAFVAIRPSGMTEMEYIRQVRAGLIPWKSKTQVQNDLAKCRYDWTTRNMQTFATLFAVPPVHVSQVIA